MERLIDRREAGKTLATHLNEWANQEDVIVLALPRGGVPVGYEVAKKLSAPLDIFVVRKLGVPGHQELAMGAIASGGMIYFNQEMMHSLNLSPDVIDAVIASEQHELIRRETTYRGSRPFPTLKGKTVILIDDGIATGATVRAALKALREQNPKKIILAAPVAPFSVCQELAIEADELVCPLRPKDFYAVGAWYDHFPQTTDHEILELLKSL